MKTLGQFLIQYLVTMASEREREKERDKGYRQREIRNYFLLKLG